MMPQALSAMVEPAAEPDEPARLLIVDDIEDNREVLARRFVRRGFIVEQAESGRAALDRIAAERFDLVLLDIVMPDIEGVEVLRQIRREHDSASLPVIMVTARTVSRDVVRALESGADDYLTKPINFAVALARVNSQIARCRTERQIRRAADHFRQTARDLQETVRAHHMLRATTDAHRSNELLEAHIRERTRDLLAVNEQLRAEIANRERSEAAITFLAHHDALTGLPNRVLFQQTLRQWIEAPHAKGEELAVLYIDLDGFKAINDMLGHAFGDDLLRAVAVEMTAIVAGRGLVARLGGDEFAVMLAGRAAAAAAPAIAAALVAAIAAMETLRGEEIAIGASIGLACAEASGTDVEDLLRRADLAMYRAKAEGRGTWRAYRPDMDDAAKAQRAFELDLRRALTQQEFRLDYQPIIDVANRRITGFEALLRWQHPERGDLLPEAFIPHAEATGLMGRLGEWAVGSACREAMRWPASYRVAVNLSPFEVNRGPIVGIVRRALASSGLDPGRLELEITEAALLTTGDQSILRLQQLRQLGARIVLDDFGKGYAGLGQLRRFGFDKLKLDRSFVESLPGDPLGSGLVKALATISRHYALTVAAEGIETADQLQFFSRHGFAEVQGHLFGTAAPAAALPALINTPLSWPAG